MTTNFGLPILLNRGDIQSLYRIHNGQQTETSIWEHKLKALAEVDKNVRSETQIAKECGVPCSTLSAQMKNKETLNQTQ